MKDKRFLNRQIKRLATAIKRNFKAQANYLIKELKDVVPETQNNSFQSDKVAAIIASLPNKEKIVKEILKTAGFSMSKGASRTETEIKLSEFGISFDMKHPDAVKWLQAKEALQLSNYKGSISEVTNRNIQRIIVEGLSTGESYSELAQRIRDQEDLGVFSTKRAERIAVYETGHAYEEGKLIPVQEFKAKYPERQVMKIWQTVNDTKVTPECMSNQNEGWIPDEQPWGSGDMIPPRSSNIGCRCTCSRRID